MTSENNISRHLPIMMNVKNLIANLFCLKMHFDIIDIEKEKRGGRL
jgi:hypothetical protein